MTTSNLQTAQTAVSDGQALIDRAAAKYVEAGATLEAAMLIADIEGEPDLLVRVMNALAKRYPDDDLGALGVRGRARCEPLVGSAVGLGSALDYLVSDLVAASFLDPAVFAEKVRECGRAIADGDALAEVAAMPQAIEDLAIVRRDVTEAVNHFLGAIKTESRDAALVRRIAHVAAEIYEKAAPLWAWARVILNSQREATSYGTAIRKDATDNVGSIGNRLPILASGAPSYIRHAPHHGRALTVNEDGSRVSVTLRGFEGHFTVNEYLDKVFALVESVLALNWCLADAPDRAGIDVPLSPSDAGYLGASTAKQAVFFLTHFRGYSVSRSEVVDRVWYLDVDMPAEEVLTTAIVIGGAADSDVHTVVLRRLEATGEPVRLGASEVRDHLAAVENAHGLEGVVLVAEFIEQLEMRGGSGLMATQLESVVTAVAVSVVEGHLEDAPLLRRVRMLADRAGRGDLVEVAIATIASVRTGEVERAKQQLAPLAASFDSSNPMVFDAVELYLSA